MGIKPLRSERLVPIVAAQENMAFLMKFHLVEIFIVATTTIFSSSGIILLTEFYFKMDYSKSFIWMKLYQ